MSPSHTLTPVLSRAREREQQPETAVLELKSFPHKRQMEQQPGTVATASNSLSRTRERARVRVRVRARALREGQTDAEALLWSRLRDRQLSDLKFRRERPINPYFADFAGFKIGLVIELDGGQHVDGASTSHDQKRSTDLVSLGFQTLRFWNNDVLTQTDAVVEKILQIAETLTPAFSRQRKREQEYSKGKKS